MNDGTIEFLIHTAGAGLISIGLLFINEGFANGIGYGMMAMGLMCLTFRLDGE